LFYHHTTLAFHSLSLSLTLSISRGITRHTDRNKEIIGNKSFFILYVSSFPYFLNFPHWLPCFSPPLSLSPFITYFLPIYVPSFFLEERELFFIDQQAFPAANH
jgi:hypothetical protein